MLRYCVNRMANKTVTNIMCNRAHTIPAKEYRMELIESKTEEYLYHEPFVLIETSPPLCSICNSPMANMCCNLRIPPVNCPIELSVTPNKQKII